MKFVRAADLRAAEKEVLKGLGEGADAAQGQWVREVGACVAEVTGGLLDEMGGRRGAVVVAGPGMNGADGLAAAAMLAKAGYRCEVWATVNADAGVGIRGALLAECRASGVAVEEVRDWTSRAGRQGEWRPGVLVDAVFGTGFHGEPSGNEGEAMGFLRSVWPGVIRVAVDVPSGWNGEGAEVPEWTPRADVTVTAGRPKAGMGTAAGVDVCGRIEVASFGIPGGALEGIELPGGVEGGVTDLITRQEVAGLFPRRRAGAAHKGDFGRLLLLGGCESYPGAITLCALGALRSGAGMVYVGTSPTALTAIAARVPGAIPDDDLFAMRKWDRYAAAVIGPGLGQSPEARRVVASSLYGAGSPIVIDADAISLLAGRPEALRSCGRPIVMTPHAAELSRVLGWSVEQIRNDRAGAVRKAADLCGVVVLLKGQGTLVAAPGDERIWMNPTGNPGMACGGSGDVLAGLIGGLLAQGLSPLDAARAGAWLHGHAGDLCAARLTEMAMNAEDVAAALPRAFMALRDVEPE